MSVTDNGDGTATIAGTLNTAQSSDVTSTFTLRATATSSGVNDLVADRTFTITETSVDPVIGTFPVTAIPTGFTDSYAITATQSDGTIPSLTLRDQNGQNSGTFKIGNGYWSNGPQALAGSGFVPSAPNDNNVENDFTFTDNGDGSATLEITPKGHRYSGVGDNIVGANNDSTIKTVGGVNTRVNQLTTIRGGEAIKFIVRASTAQGTVDKTFEVPLHPAPYINTGAVYVGSSLTGNMYELGNGSTTYSKGASHTVNLGFIKKAYNSTTANTSPNIDVIAIEDNEVAVHGNTTVFDSFSLTDAGVLTFQVKSSTSATVAYLNTLIRDDDTNAQRQYQLRIQL